VSVLADGSAFITGSFRDIATFGDLTLTPAAESSSVYVAKISATGTWVWATRAGGPNDGGGRSVSVLANGSAIVTGSFAGSATFGATELTSAGNRDVFVAKISPTGNWVWAISAGGSEFDGGNGVSVLANGSAIVTGSFAGSATFGATELTSTGADDVFVARISASGSFDAEVAPDAPVPGPGFVVAQDGSVPVVSPGGALVLDASGRALESQMSLVSGSGGGVTIAYDDGNGMALSVIVSGDRGAIQASGPIAAPSGSFEIALAFGDRALVPDGEVVEVWMFSTPRLVAAGRLGPDGRGRITVPFAAPLDGGEAIPAGAHTLQVLIPSRGGRIAVNVGVTVGGPVPVSVPAGEGPVPVWPLLVSILVGTVVLRRVSSAGVLG